MFVIGVIAVMLPVLSVLFLVFGYRALSAVSPENRKMRPGLVFLNLIPLFNFGWSFRSVVAIAGSLQRVTASRTKRKGQDSCGRNSGIAGCVLQILAVSLVFTMLLISDEMYKARHYYGSYASEKEMTSFGYLLCGIALAVILSHVVVMIIHLVAVFRQTEFILVSPEDKRRHADTRLAGSRVSSVYQGRAGIRNGHATIEKPGMKMAGSNGRLMTIALAGAILASIGFLFYRSKWLINVVNLSNLAGATLALVACLMYRTGQGSPYRTGLVGFTFSMTANLVLMLVCHAHSQDAAFLFMSGLCVQLAGFLAYLIETGR